MNGDTGPGTGAPGAEAAAPPGGGDVGDDALSIAMAAFTEGGGETTQATELAAQTGEGEQATPPPTDAGQAEQSGQQETPPPAADELAALRAENERLKAGQQAQTAPQEVTQLRSFLGLDPIHEGGPTFEQIGRLVDARDYAGLNQLRRPDGTTGYSLEEAIDLRRELQGRQQIMDGSTKLIHGMAWNAIGSAFDQHLTALGLDAKAVTEEAAKAGNPLATTGVYLTKIVEAAKKAGREEGAREWKGKHDGLKNEFDAFKASAAGGAAGLESGGRGNGQKGAASVLALNDDEFVERAIRGDFVGVDMRD